MEYFEADHWDEMDLKTRIEWDNTAPNFTPYECRSRGDGSVRIRRESLERLQRLRHLYGKPLTLTSAWRDLDYNRSIGSTDASQHVKGRAFDIAIEDGDMGRELERLAKKVGFTAIGRYSTFIHVDDRDSGRDVWWGLPAWP